MWGWCNWLTSRSPKSKILGSNPSPHVTWLHRLAVKDIRVSIGQHRFRSRWGYFYRLARRVGQWSVKPPLICIVGSNPTQPIVERWLSGLKRPPAKRKRVINIRRGFKSRPLRFESLV